MQGPVEIPICDDDGRPTGETVQLEGPPPAVMRVRPGSRLELRHFRELNRFGCGCIWEDRLAYVERSETRGVATA